jgi:sugar phosphate isomerase/epimerase
MSTRLRQIRDAGLRVASYCRSSFIPAPTQEQFRANVEDNKRAIRDAATLGAPCFVMVVGGLAEGSKDLAHARDQVEQGTAELLAAGRYIGVRISLEPLHPVYAADRSCLNTTAQVLDICDRLEPKGGDAPGSVADVITSGDLISTARSRAPAPHHCFHVCDWRMPCRDPLTQTGR